MVNKKHQDNKAPQGDTRKKRKPAGPAAAKFAESPVLQLSSAIETLHEQRVNGFPIVGIGASAGGLEAFEKFFRVAQPDSGMAFVLVSHLDPDQPSMLAEILQPATTMPVIEAQDQMVVAPDCVYVIPPNRDMSIFHGVLQLGMPEHPSMQRMPIDAFLRSLADDQGERAIGIILSGNGTDGTLGLRAILGAGGVALVQEPSSAKYDGMPSSAVNAGYATHILAVEKMPEALLTDLHTQAIHQEVITTPAAAHGMDHILSLLRSGTGHDFSLYKKNTIGRRIERRMSQHNIEDMQIYARYLKEHPAEVKQLFKELLINVTSFFRDAEAFDMLKQNILPQLLEGKPEGYEFRAWVAGCASGEEVYSIAILLREFMDETRQELKIKLYATDLDEDAIDAARFALYSPNIVQDVTPERLRRFFIKEEAGYRVKKEIREMVVFATHNVIKDPPFTRLDLLSCRNLMIYLEQELQDRLIPVFHYALKPGGVLFLSASESIGKHAELFAPLNRKWKFYRATGAMTSTRALMSGGLLWTNNSRMQAPDEVTRITRETNFAEAVKRTLLEFYAPASVVTDLKGDILYVHGETGKYLRPAPGRATLNVVDMARDGLQLELRIALNNASQGSPALNRPVSVKSNGDEHAVTLNIRPLPGPDAYEELLLVSFQDVAQPMPEKLASGKRTRGVGIDSQRGEFRRIEELERELAYSRESLQSTIEKQQVSNEELKSTNEELQSTNEELQSTNEELETSREELQSVNEEIITMNAELQTKVELLDGMQNDLKNLLDNICAGTIILDEHLKIKRFTREAVQVYHLLASDVGRPLSDIKSEIVGEDLLKNARIVLDTLAPFEREVRSSGGAWYQVRIRPYRTLSNVIEGVVLTFTDISQLVDAEAQIKSAHELAEAIVDTIREPLIVLDGKLKIVSASRAFYRKFMVTVEETEGKSIFELSNRQWDIQELRELLENILPRNGRFEDYAMEYDFPVIGHHKLLLNARRISSAMDTKLILLAIEDAS